MKISKREKNLLLVILGVVLLFITYYFGYRTIQSEREKLNRQNTILDAQIQALETIEATKDDYEKETEELKTSIEDYIKKFPANVAEEDVILYAKNTESSTDSYIYTVTTPNLENIMLSPQKETNLLNEYEDITGAITANRYVNDGSIPSTDEMYLSSVESNVTYSITYDGLKKMLKEIEQDDDRKSMDNVSLVFNENTGDLSGSMTINYYALSGTGKEYLQPKTAGAQGVSSIFGNLRSRASASEEEEAETVGEAAAQ